MDDVGLRFTLGSGIIKTLIAIFLVGFLPGLYFPYIKFTNAKKHPLIAIPLSFIIGVVCGGVWMPSRKLCKGVQEASRHG
jgi:uncharacterized membrane protein